MKKGGMNEEQVREVLPRNEILKGIFAGTERILSEVCGYPGQVTAMAGGKVFLGGWENFARHCGKNIAGSEGMMVRPITEDGKYKNGDGYFIGVQDEVLYELLRLFPDGNVDLTMAIGRGRDISPWFVLLEEMSHMCCDYSYREKHGHMPPNFFLEMMASVDKILVVEALKEDGAGVDWEEFLPVINTSHYSIAERDRQHLLGHRLGQAVFEVCQMLYDEGEIDKISQILGYVKEEDYRRVVTWLLGDGEGSLGLKIPIYTLGEREELEDLLRGYDLLGTKDFFEKREIEENRNSRPKAETPQVEVPLSQIVTELIDGSLYKRGDFARMVNQTNTGTIADLPSLLSDLIVTVQEADQFNFVEKAQVKQRLEMIAMLEGWELPKVSRQVNRSEQMALRKAPNRPPR